MIKLDRDLIQSRNCWFLQI